MDETKISQQDGCDVLYAFGQKRNIICVCAVVQDCDRRGEERCLASHSGERIHSHETRGKGEGAEHVQRCEFISITFPEGSEQN